MDLSFIFLMAFVMLSTGIISGKKKKLYSL